METNEMKLFKYDTEADAKKHFSITKALNDNWDKIDDFAGKVNQFMEEQTVSGLDYDKIKDITIKIPIQKPVTNDIEIGYYNIKSIE